MCVTYTNVFVGVTQYTYTKIGYTTDLYLQDHFVYKIAVVVGLFDGHRNKDGELWVNESEISNKRHLSLIRSNLKKGK